MLGMVASLARRVLANGRGLRVGYESLGNDHKAGLAPLCPDSCFFIRTQSWMGALVPLMLFSLVYVYVYVTQAKAARW